LTCVHVFGLVHLARRKSSCFPVVVIRLGRGVRRATMQNFSVIRIVTWNLTSQYCNCFHVRFPHQKRNQSQSVIMTLLDTLFTQAQTLHTGHNGVWLLVPQPPKHLVPSAKVWWTEYGSWTEDAGNATTTTGPETTTGLEKTLQAARTVAILIQTGFQLVPRNSVGRFPLLFMFHKICSTTNQTQNLLPFSCVA